MATEDFQKEVQWLKHEDLVTFTQSDAVPAPWFPAFKVTKSANE